VAFNSKIEKLLRWGMAIIKYQTVTSNTTEKGWSFMNGPTILVDPVVAILTNHATRGETPRLLNYKGGLK
jgi:hypothetical protein